MLPPLSLNHAAFEPPASMMPPFVFMPGVS